MRHQLAPILHHDVLNELAAALRADLPGLTDETEGLLHREQPALVARIDQAMIRDGIGFTHERFVALLEGGAADDRDRHVAFGAAMAGAGVSVEELLAGYRVGAQVCWRHLARHATRFGLDAGVVLSLASAAMAYGDELAANSLEGYANAAEASYGARARERQALLDAL
ncbi:MAG: transcriptional regulator, CdaR, partial [Conexibacter sp.]|nr:transcriptional regulator, CdaR [Conexibacter sp.]